jgi:hypothetical protein
MEMADHVRTLREQGLAVPLTIRSLPIMGAAAQSGEVSVSE